MATTTFTDLNISDTYLGILHVNGEPLPATSQQRVYDADGNASDMTLGRLGQGASFVSLSSQTGRFFNLSANNLYSGGVYYPTAPGPLSAVMVQGANQQLVLSPKIPVDSIPDLVPNPAGTYTQISAVSINSAGQVTSIITTGASSGLTITATTYMEDASTPRYITTPLATYTTSLDFADVPDNAKTLILYIGPYLYPRGKQQELRMFSSRDGTEGNEWPVMAAGSAETSNDKAAPYMDGTQCTVRCEPRTPDPGVRMYLRTALFSQFAAAQPSLEVYLLGYQV